MSAYQRSMIKQQKNFYRNYYRRFVVASFGSMVLSLLLCAAIFYQYLSRPIVTFYASNTAGFITSLTALSEPNQANQYLLAPDLPEEMTLRELNVE